MTLAHCIAACQRCHSTALEAVTWSLRQGGAVASAEHVSTMLDCAAISATCVDFLARGSDHHARVCAVCAEICERCAELCQEHRHDELRAHIEAARSCAESCRALAH
jgi:hypothetical protein